MSKKAKRPAPSTKGVLNLADPEMTAGKMRDFGGSKADPFNRVLLNDTLNTLWTKHSSEEWKEGQYRAVAGALIGIAPQDELEGMLAAQMIAAHQASMECFRRAMLHDQSFEGRKENLSQASKLSRTYATLLEALNRHRGKGQQKVTVEHVHVHAGGQAIVGPCRSPAMPNGRCRMHGGASPGAPTGKANGNYRHGRFTKRAVERRRELNALIRSMQKTAREVR